MAVGPYYQVFGFACHPAQTPHAVEPAGKLLDHGTVQSQGVRRGPEETEGGLACHKPLGKEGNVQKRV